MCPWTAETGARHGWKPVLSKCLATLQPGLGLGWQTRALIKSRADDAPVMCSKRNPNCSRVVQQPLDLHNNSIQTWQCRGKRRGEKNVQTA
jgi:hypothetical protein